jgi:hypothetical protein
MIVYLDTNPDRDTPPPWLVGAHNLHRRDGAGRRWWGVGSTPWLVGPHDGDWQDLDDGWRCLLVGELDPVELRRAQRWCDTEPAVDLAGRRWAAPVILGPDGLPIFRVNYGGRDFLPLLTPEQLQAKAVAEAARQALASGGIDGPFARQWVATLLAITHHLSVQVIGALGILDDALVLSTLQPAAGKRLRFQSDIPPVEAEAS